MLRSNAHITFTKSTRSVADGAIAAAVAVALELELAKGRKPKHLGHTRFDTPWVIAGRIKASRIRALPKKHAPWGMTPGWR